METRDKELKLQVRDYWNAHPCGTQFTELQWGSREFFHAVEKHRYETQPFMQEVLGFNRFKDKRLLEIGCGLGTDLLQFARGGAQVTGIDLTPQSIDLAKKRFALENQAADFRVADAENLPFDDGSFDVVYSFGVLHHTPNTQQAIEEIYRVLKPGGRIIIMLYHKRSVHVWLGASLYKFSGKYKNHSISLSDDWVRVYDGDMNPLGKAYTRSDMKAMFSRFKNFSTTLCDPIRKRYPEALNAVNQAFLARWTGFWMVVKGEK